jgi:hypothetical protein
MSKDTIVLYQGWEWKDLWHVEEGWEYAVDFTSKFHASKELLD